MEAYMRDYYQNPFGKSELSNGQVRQIELDRARAEQARVDREIDHFIKEQERLNKDISYKYSNIQKTIYLTSYTPLN